MLNHLHYIFFDSPSSNIEHYSADKPTDKLLLWDFLYSMLELIVQHMDKYLSKPMIHAHALTVIFLTSDFVSLQDPRNAEGNC